jgi:hypothetical protein
MVVSGLEGLLFQAWMLCVVIMLGLGALFGLTMLAKKLVEFSFTTAGRPLGPKWSAFCERAEDITNRALRPFMVLVGITFVGMLALVFVKDPFGGCGWAGVMCE